MDRKTLFAILGGVGVVALAIALAIAISSDVENRPRIHTADIDIDGADLPPFQAPGAADEAIGQPAPALQGVDFAGETLTVELGDGQPHLLFFLAHWCPACQEEVPKLVDWYEDAAGVDRAGTGDGVRVLFVSTSVDSGRGNFPPGVWLRDEGWTEPVLVDDARASAFSAYGGTQFPYLVAVDGDGTVAYRLAGMSGPQAWDDIVTFLNSGEVPGA